MLRPHWGCGGALQFRLCAQTATTKQTKDLADMLKRASDKETALKAEALVMWQDVIAKKHVAVASIPHRDLIRAPYVFYGVKYIGLVSLALFPGHGQYLWLYA